jgi:hypothetical protein
MCRVRDRVSFSLSFDKSANCIRLSAVRVGLGRMGISEPCSDTYVVHSASGLDARNWVALTIDLFWQMAASW